MQPNELGLNQLELVSLQTPSVEGDSNFISADQMSIVKKEFGKNEPLHPPPTTPSPSHPLTYF